MTPDQIYQKYLAEGAQLLAAVLDNAHFEQRGGRLEFTATLPASLIDKLSNWGADLSDLEAEVAA